MALARIALVGALVAVALPVSVASVAEAAEVRLERFYFDCTRKQCPPNYGERLVVRAARGEVNRLSVGLGAAGGFQVRDAGPALHAGPGCVLSAEQLVACPTSTPLVAAYVLAGDRGDRVTSSVAVTVDGGGGDDRLTGSPLADALFGGKGRDVVRGNGADDALLDGRLPRLVTPEEDMGRSFPPSQLGPAIAVPAESDVFDGGAGSDTLSYGGRRRGVFADLARRDRHAGARGEGDQLRRLENLIGGDSDDRLLGNDAANRLYGGDNVSRGSRAGDDFADGRAGDDRIALGGGANRARGGAGDDDIEVTGGYDPHPQAQRVACGPGRDRTSVLFRNDFAEDDCESVVIAEFHQLQVLLPPINLARPPLASYTTGPADCLVSSCGLRLDVRLARSPSRRLPRLKGLLLGRTTATIPYRAVTTLTVHLSDRGSRLLRRYKGLLIRIHLEVAQSGHPDFAAAGAYLTRLRAPAP
jgi:RTX calcium-binding nonapeptide repeat (4 copies)